MCNAKRKTPGPIVFRRALKSDPHLRSSPFQGEGKIEEAGFFRFGCARGFGWWKRVIREALWNNTRKGLKVECHASRLIRGWGALAGVEKDPGSLGGACPERSRTGSG